jgi:hypothetical protein
MGVKISELSEANSVQNADLLVIVQNGETKKIQKSTLFQKNVITAGLESDVTLSSVGAYNLTLNATISKTGDKFSLVNGKIVVGEGISHILIGANFFLAVGTTSGPKNFYITLNGTEVIQILNSNVSSSANLSSSASPVLFPVNSGDVIGVSGYGATGDIVRSTTSRMNITVQAID